MTPSLRFLSIRTHQYLTRTSYLVEGISNIKVSAEGQETGTKPVGADKIRANAHRIGIPDPVVSDVFGSNIMAHYI